MATSGDFLLATDGDFLMAMGTLRPSRCHVDRLHPYRMEKCI